VNIAVGTARVREAAKKDRHLRFTSLLHYIKKPFLDSAYHNLKKTAAVGVDGVSWEEYGRDLSRNLENLIEEIHSERYRATPSKRTWIPKASGGERPIGIAAIEDKIVQQALVWVLEEIYEVDFLGFSYGFRPNRNQHNALDALYVCITQRKVSWILDADIKGFFDNIDHDKLMECLGIRIGDKRVLRLIRRFLKAGVMEDGELSSTVVGTPQGSVLSPMLANIYLHYVQDVWVNSWRKNRARGEVYIVRYADDSVIGFQYKSDAEDLLRALKSRFAQYGLELHEKKTRLIEFGRFAEQNRRLRLESKPETFDFLGFTHICGKRRCDGKFTLTRKTIGKRINKKCTEIADQLMKRRHWRVDEVGKWLRSVLRGHYNYYAVPGNSQALSAFKTAISHAWLHALRRRSHKGRSMNWNKMSNLIRFWLPSPKIVHPYPNQRLRV
jgi:RNA-directed DNA polymerase